MRSGFAKRRPVPIRRSALAHTMEKEVFKILFACSLSPFPRLIEKSGAPPLPNRFAASRDDHNKRKTKSDSTKCCGPDIRDTTNINAVYNVIEQT